MLSGFVGASAPVASLSSSRTSFARGCTCVRRRPCTTSISIHRRITTPSMLAKYQRKEENSQSELENETDLEKLVPPPALPTLSTLSGTPQEQTDIDLSRISSDSAPSEGARQEDQEPVNSMGAGLSAQDELFVVTFLKGCVDEFQLIEWPSFSRIVKVTLLIVGTLAVAVVALYFIDGFFYRLSQAYFDGV